MEIDDEEILRGLAAGRSMDYSSWPALLPRVTARIEKIAREEFPIPKLPPPPPPPRPFSSAATIPSSIARGPDSDLPDNFLAPLSSSPSDRRNSSPLSDTNKENNNPVIPQTAAPAPSAPAPAPASSAPLPPGALPPQLDSMLSDITSYLETTFPKYPPHTIQRISELVVTPRQHYRSLITYLHALDRVVRVTSGLNVYPLPSTHAEIPGLANGVLEAPVRPSPWASPGSDEALGGALLTPIPWISHNQRPVTGSAMQAAQLSQPPQSQHATSAQEVPAEFEGEVRTESTETIDGPNGVGSIETVSVSVNGIPSMGARGVSVTQGELLRQEQEAGVVPVSQLVPSHHIPNASAAAQQQQQQQIQARIQQQRSLAQSQNQARVTPPSAEPSDSPSPASDEEGSTPSSATLGRESVGAAADNIPVAIGSIHSNNAEDEDKPLASGPEEIGADDLGPQSSTSSTLATSTAAGSRMQGIDVQAAVGRKPLDAVASSKSDEDTKDGESDEMDVDEDKSGGRASTPKRTAEDELAASASKKVKEEDSSEPASTEENSKPSEAESESETVKDEDAMDKD